VEYAIRIHTFILLSSYARLLYLLVSSQPPTTIIVMAAELPPSWFRTMGSLASLCQMMGWQAPGLTPKLKHGVVSLANCWCFLSIE
jgi:hypothetical protein